VVLRDGWLDRQFEQVSKNVANWPEWMKRAAGFESHSRIERAAVRNSDRESLPKATGYLEPEVGPLFSSSTPQTNRKTDRSGKR
jgi:hypothetical protein